jgi:hypothetical protein
VEEVINLPTAKLFFRIWYLIDQLEPSIRIGCSVDIDKASLAAFAHEHQALVLHDPEQPGCERPFEAKAIEALESLGEGVLHFVFGIAAVSEHLTRPLKAGFEVPLYEFGEGTCIASLSLQRQFFVSNLRGFALEPRFWFAILQEFRWYAGINR